MVLETFLDWLSIVFRIDERPSSTLGEAKIYFHFVKEGKLVNKADLTKSSFSRIKSKMIKEGFIYKATLLPDRQEYLIPLHPTVAVNYAASKHITTEKVVREKFGDIVNELEKNWAKNFGHFWGEQSSCLFPVECWASPVAYGNFLGWIMALKERVGKIIILTPHLKLLSNELTRNMLKRFQEKSGIKYEFLCMQQFAEELEGQLQFDVEFWAIDPKSPVPENYRAAVFYDRDDTPIFSFEALKLLVINRYVGAIYYMHESLEKIDKMLNISKDVSKKWK